MFSDRQVIAMAKQFVWVEIDSSIMRYRQDASGQFFRKLYEQRTGADAGAIHQGLYLAAPNGDLLHYWNQRDPDVALSNLKETLKGYRARDHNGGSKFDWDTLDEKMVAIPPKDAVVLKVFCKVIKAKWQDPSSDSTKLYRESVGRDHMWISASEVEELRKGKWPQALTQRMRFHLDDFARGEADFWESGELSIVDALEYEASSRGKWVMNTQLRFQSGDRSYTPRVQARVEFRSGKLIRFDLVALGTASGAGQYVSGTPPGERELLVSMRLSEPEEQTLPPKKCRVPSWGEPEVYLRGR